VADHPAVRGAIPISGIFDLEPIALGVLNDKLQLTAGEVESLSPIRNLPDHSPPIRLFVGADELPELRRQSQDYAEVANQRGLPVTVTALPGHHHFSIVNEFAKPDGALTAALVDLVKTSK
jgi:arylformamidase